MRIEETSEKPDDRRINRNAITTRIAIKTSLLKRNLNIFFMMPLLFQKIKI